MAASDIRIEPVTDQRGLRAFIMFPFELYRSDKYWVPPLIGERFKHFDPQSGWPPAAAKSCAAR